MQKSGGKFSENTTIILQQAIQESSKHSMQLRSITGGQDFESLSRTMSKDVEHVNNSKLIVRVLLQTGLESEIDALSSKRTWLQHMCCALITPDVLIFRKRKERLSGKGENDRKRGWNSPS
jgi:hypothetical protein